MPAETSTQQRPLHHAVKLTIEAGGYVEGEIVCNAPAGSPCRMSCPTGECGYWAGDECDCGLLAPRPGDQCGAAEWIDNEGVIDAYAGPPAEIRSGLVEIEWDSGYRWTYPAALVSEAAA
jgi:hypothetical protein